MNAGIDIVLTAIAATLLFAMAIYSILKGSPPPQGTWVEKYYRAQPNLGLVGNLFVLALCGFGFAKLATHLGLIDRQLGATIRHFTEVVGFLLGLAYVWLWLRARRAIQSSKDEAAGS